MTVTPFSNPFRSDTPVHEGLPLSVYQEVLHSLAERMPEDQFRSISLTVLRQALQLLDPQQQGLSLFVLQCTPPATGKPVQSLSLRLDQAAFSRIEEIPACPLFFGAQSLSAFAVISGHVAFVPNTTVPLERQLFVNWHHAQCIVAHPIKRFGRCAGSLTAFSSFPLQGPDRMLLQEAASLLSFALPEQDFFADEQIAFQIMPPLQTQIDHLSLYRQRFLSILSEARRSGQTLSVAQAECLVLQQFEQDLSQLVFRDQGVTDTVASAAVSTQEV
jgi:hypothetical protein